jgi:hypothetical protein
MNAVERLFEKQHSWVTLNKMSMEQRYEMFQHLLALLRREIEQEHKREAETFNLVGQELVKRQVLANLADLAHWSMKRSVRCGTISAYVTLST